MGHIKISDISYSHDGKLELLVTRKGEANVLWFELPGDIRPHPDLVACSVAAIFGTAPTEYEFLAPITEGCRKSLEKATNAVWNAPVLDAQPPSSGSRIALNFSGGLDSLAALALIGDRTPLVSLDLGDRFARERLFFDKFDPFVVRTNVVDFTPEWTFMGLGAILLKEYLSAGYISFGSIFEGSKWSFLKRNKPAESNLIFSAAGLEQFNPVAGITELGTALIAAMQYPDLMDRSLESLADPRSEKYRRKHLILSIVEERIGEKLIVNSAPPLSNEQLPLGVNFAADFLAPGIFANSSSQDFAKWMNEPGGFSDFFPKGFGEFYWKENTGFHGLSTGPEYASAGVNATKNRLGIKPYVAQDWDDLRKVTGFLKVFHSFPGETW